MNGDLEKAKTELMEGEYTCVLRKDGKTYTSTQRGVKPLVAWCDSGEDLHGFSAADKVVGRGAAFLYVLLGVCAVYAGVVSSTALDLLKSRGIFVEYGTLTDHIVNRRGDGVCPFEEAVREIDDADTAYRVIREKMKEMGISPD